MSLYNEEIVVYATAKEPLKAIYSDVLKIIEDHSKNQRNKKKCSIAAFFIERPKYFKNGDLGCALTYSEVSLGAFGIEKKSFYSYFKIFVNSDYPCINSWLNYLESFSKDVSVAIKLNSVERDIYEIYNRNRFFFPQYYHLEMLCKNLDKEDLYLSKDFETSVDMVRKIQVSTNYVYLSEDYRNVTQVAHRNLQKLGKERKYYCKTFKYIDVCRSGSKRNPEQPIE